MALTFDTGTVAAIGAAAVLIIGAIVTGVISIIAAVHNTRVVVDTKVAVDQVVAGGVTRDQKLDRIEVLVDGRYSEVLQELADVKKLLAKATGIEADTDRAENAQGAADRQEIRVAAAGGKTPLPTVAPLPEVK